MVEYRHTRKIQGVATSPSPRQQAETIEELYVDAVLAHEKLVKSFEKGKEEQWVEVSIDLGKFVARAKKQYHIE